MRLRTPLDRPPPALLRVGERLGSGLAGVVNVCDPRRVILGGAEKAFEDLLRDPADVPWSARAKVAP